MIALNNLENIYYKSLSGLMNANFLKTTTLSYYG